MCACACECVPACLCLCVPVCVCVSELVSVCLCVCACVRLCVSVCVSLCVSVCCVCVSVPVSVCLPICVWLCVCLCVLETDVECPVFIPLHLLPFRQCPNEPRARLAVTMPQRSSWIYPLLYFLVDSRICTLVLTLWAAHTYPLSHLCNSSIHFYREICVHIQDSHQRCV